MKTLKLNISERLFALKLINGFKGDLETLSHLMEDTKKFTITEKDWKKSDRQIQLVKDEMGKDITQWTWNDEKGGELEIELNNKTKEYLLSEIGRMDKEKTLTLLDKSVLSLKNKLVD